MVVEARVVKPCLRGERGGMRGCPGAGHVFDESLGAGVKRCEPPGPALPSDLRIEIAGVAACAERPRRVPVGLPARPAVTRRLLA